MTTNHKHFRLQDLSEIVVGSVLLAFPIAITEEVGNLGKALSLFSRLVIVASSLFFLTWFAFHTFYQPDLSSHRNGLILRVVSVYCVALPCLRVFVQQLSTHCARSRHKVYGLF